MHVAQLKGDGPIEGLLFTFYKIAPSYSLDITHSLRIIVELNQGEGGHTMRDTDFGSMCTTRTCQGEAETVEAGW